MLINDSHQYFNRYKSSCASCVHFNEETFSCVAFKEIPISILQGENKHVSRYRDQIGGTVYEDVQKLHDKFIAGTITARERKVLYSRYAELFTDPQGKVNRDKLNDFLVTSHKSYGKPVNGVVSTV